MYQEAEACVSLSFFCVLYPEVSQSLWVSGLGGCGWGTVSGTNLTGRSGAGCEQPCLLCWVWDRAACRLHVLPRMINTSIFSCYPFGLHYKQAALIDVYSFQKVNMCLKGVWTIPVFLCWLCSVTFFVVAPECFPFSCAWVKNVLTGLVCLGCSFLLLLPAIQQLHSRWTGHSRFTLHLSAETVWEICLSLFCYKTIFFPKRQVFICC